MTVTLHKEQQEAVDNLATGKILCGDVGSGKSITSLVYFFTKVCGGVVGDLGSMRTPKDLYILTTAKKRDTLDWEIEAAKLSITSDAAASVEGISITVDSWNNINKYREVKDAFFIFDEQRVVGSGAWTKAFGKITKHNAWILLSATPGDTWLDYIPVFVANGFYKNRTEFKREHVIYNTFSKFPKVDRYVGVGRLVRHRNAILVEMPVSRHTTRHLHTVSVDYDKELFERVVKKRWHVYENRPLKDVAELFGVMRKVVNSNTSRVETVRKLLEQHPKLIVFYNFDYELDLLRSLGAELRTPEMPSSTSPELLQKSKTTTEDPTQAHPGYSVWGKSENSSPPWKTCSPTSQGCATSSAHVTEKLADAIPIAAGLGSSDLTFAVAEWNGHKHEQIPTTERWLYLVQYRAGAEGWNCVETDAMVFYSLTYSYKDFYQCQGRIDRLNTPFFDLHYYILMSDSLIDKAVSKSLKVKKSFNERDFVGKTSF